MIGHSTRWGKIYQWTTGRFKEAVDFLTKAKGGILKGVFHRDDIGDISIGWGEAPNNYNGRGLAHIIRKHINIMHDFNSIEEIIRTIEDVIKNGKRNKNNDGNYELEDDSYRVVIVNDEDGNLNKNKLSRAMQEGKVIYTREALLSNSSEWRLAEHQENDVPDLLPTQENNASSTDKVTKSPKGFLAHSIIYIQKRQAKKERHCCRRNPQ